MSTAPVALACLVGLAVGALGCKSQASPAPPPSQPRFVHAGAPPAPVADVADAVRRELATARGEGREVLVYVGATWCEPCQRFHQALDAGQLDTAFPTLTLLELDADRDGDALRAAGYSSDLIPLFAAPTADGRASGRQIEGSIKGEGAVAEITPRLRALLASTRRP